MKNSILFFFVLLSFAACKDDPVIEPSELPLSEKIVGTWQSVYQTSPLTLDTNYVSNCYKITPFEFGFCTETNAYTLVGDTIKLAENNAYKILEANQNDLTLFSLSHLYPTTNATHYLERAE